jgi:hypothetical protein
MYGTNDINEYGICQPVIVSLLSEQNNKSIFKEFSTEQFPSVDHQKTPLVAFPCTKGENDFQDVCATNKFILVFYKCIVLV